MRSGLVKAPGGRQTELRIGCSTGIDLTQSGKDLYYQNSNLGLGEATLQPDLAEGSLSHNLDELTLRAIQTLTIMHGWGYAPSVETLANELLGGSADTSVVLSFIKNSPTMSLQDGFVFLEGNEGLVAKSKERVASHRRMNGEALSVATEFAHDLLRACPVVDCVALSGSAASGGYACGDDVDFDLFTRDGTKYLVYGISLALGLRAALRRWRIRGFRKLVCINVIWSRSESTPFERQDEGLAFELLRCQPLAGIKNFHDVISVNEWARRYFPQLGQKFFVEMGRPEPSLMGRVIVGISHHPRLLAIVEGISRFATRAVYETAHLVRNRDPIAMSRISFLHKVKYPYEFFQD
jgi:hypothetical protein